ncbi:MAG TPA: hypothetical protein IAB59_04980 [Candidatus Onthousia faecipullorum]|uniref:Uncharacterized protein n=1 Tax=Candidatus Onthousia faecipullorum TaxID=2840887 RepID=A0A9D1KBP6_9FIRM|nr:hypothetical protein [Candidatus Onthousia faecipullorum]
MYNDYNMGMPNYMPRRGINWNNILNNTQRTLGIINQAIPIVYQIKPLFSNARTLFRVASALNSNDDEKEEINDNNYSNNISYEEVKKDSNGPIFYL